MSACVSEWLGFPGPVDWFPVEQERGIRPPPQNAIAFPVNVIHVLVINNAIHNPLTQFVVQRVALVIRLHPYLQSHWPAAGMCDSKPST